MYRFLTCIFTACLLAVSARADLVVPLPTARDSLQARLDLLLDPELEEFNFTTFQLQTDEVGMMFISLIIAAAERGVKVRGIIDNNIDNRIFKAASPEIVRRLKEAGVELRYFHPIVPGKEFVNDPTSVVNRRMHDKLWHMRFKNGREAMLQSDKNMTNEFYPQLKDAIGYEKHTLRGQEAYLEGNVVTENKQYYEFLWNSSDVAVRTQPWFITAPDEKKKLEITIAENVKWAKSYVGKRDWRRRGIEIDTPMEFLHDDFDSFGNRTLTAAQKIYDMIEAAPNGSKIDIENFYLVMHPELEKALTNATSKGSKVRILTNMAGANYPEHFSDATVVDMEMIRRTGAELYMLRADRGTHAKLVIINDTVILSSANLDPRSVNLNSESGVIIRSKKVSDVYQASFTARIRPALPVIVNRKIEVSSVNGMPLNSSISLNQCEDIFDPARAGSVGGRALQSAKSAARKMKINATRPNL